MYCHKCGSAIPTLAAVCSHCGGPVDHQANSETYQSRAVITIPKNTIRSYSRKIKNAMAVNLIVWLSLAFPAVLLSYVFKSTSSRYHNFSFAAAYVSLGVILFLIFYFVKKGFTNPLRNVHH